MSDQLHLIRTFASEQAAQMAVAILEANGIRSIVSADRVGPMQPQLRFAPGIRLSVRRADAVAALELLEPE